MLFRSPCNAWPNAASRPGLWGAYRPKAGPTNALCLRNVASPGKPGATTLASLQSISCGRQSVCPFPMGKCSMPQKSFCFGETLPLQKGFSRVGNRMFRRNAARSPLFPEAGTCAVRPRCMTQPPNPPAQRFREGARRPGKRCGERKIRI